MPVTFQSLNLYTALDANCRTSGLNVECGPIVPERIIWIFESSRHTTVMYMPFVICLHVPVGTWRFEIEPLPMHYGSFGGRVR